MKETLHRTFYKRFSLILIISMIVICALVIKGERLLLMNDLDDKGKSIAQILSIVTLDAILAHDYATMERYTEAIARESFVQGIVVQRNDGEALAGFLPENDDDLFMAEYPILMASELYGVIRIAFSTSRIDRITWQIVWAAVGIIVVLHLLDFLLVNLVLKQTVLQPLTRLQQAMGRVAEGNLDEQVIVSGPLEFVDMAGSFNDMALRLGRSFYELEESRKNLDLERRKLDAIVSSMADGMFVTDTKETIVSFNDAATRITGYDAHEAIGRQCAQLFQSNLCKEACALCHDGETMENIETTLLTRDNRLLTVAVSSAILQDRDGNRIGGVQTFRDITEEKKRHEYYCRTEKLAAVGKLAAGIAHEINNPLGNIIGYAKMVGSDTDPASIAKRIAVIIEQAKRCSDIVRGLLDYSRTSQSNPGSVAFNSVLNNIIEILGPQFTKKNIRLEKNIQGLPPVVADERKIEQLIMNLLLNGVQAVQYGGTIGIKADYAAGEISLFIEDDGPGIPPELRNKIFDPFFTTKPVGEGTGLGLSICAGIVEELGGRIELQDTAAGTSFKVTIPVKN